MRVYIMLAQGFEEIEAVTVFDILKRAAIDVSFVSITQNKEVTSARGMKVIADLILEDINVEKEDMIVLPGGMPGTRNLEASTGLTEIIKKHASYKGSLAAICAAPLVYGGLGLLKGLQATSYPGFENELKGAVCKTDAVVKDGNVVTSRAAGTAIDFSLYLVKELKGEEVSNKIRLDILY